MSCLTPVMCPADVCASVCGWEPGSNGANLKAAKREDPGHHWVLQQTVPRVSGARPKTHPHLPQILPPHEEKRHGGIYFVITLIAFIKTVWLKCNCSLIEPLTAVLEGCKKMVHFCHWDALLWPGAQLIPAFEGLLLWQLSFCEGVYRSLHFFNL